MLCGVRALAISVAVHALVAWLLCRSHRAPSVPAMIVQQPVTRVEDAPIEVAMIEESSGGGGGTRAARGAPVHAGAHAEVAIADARAEMTIGLDAPSAASGAESGDGGGIGGGIGVGKGGGRGGGIGFGEGGGIATSATVPAPPAPPPPSRARPAKLLKPARDIEVLDDDYLFVARVTVDTDGDVAAVHMIATHPGVRGEQAASAIWSFHYAPALDDAGLPNRSTFEQPFQVR
jgi:hypothetical protein